MGDRVSKVRVLIPTTTGPVAVLRLTEEDTAIGRSVACIDGTTETADFDRAYHAFVTSPTGVIERLYNHCCYRLDVSGRIDAGSSWQLGVFAAHALHAADRLAQEQEAADTVLLVTGAVRAVDLTVREVTHVAKKVELSLDRLQAECKAGRKVRIAVPTANLPDLAGDLHAELVTAGVHLIGAEKLDVFARELGLECPTLEPAVARNGDGRPAKTRWPLPDAYQTLGIGLLVALVAVAAPLAAHLITSQSSRDPVVATSSVFDGLWEMVGEGHEPCALKTWTAHVAVIAGVIPVSRPERGFVRPTGEFRFTMPARVDPSRTNEFTGKLFGSSGEGRYQTIGGRCAGTFTLRRVKE